MKKFFVFVIISLTIILFISCKEEQATNPPVENIENFPSQAGTQYNYNLTFDTSNQVNGIRKSRILSQSLGKNYNGKVIIYQPQVDSVSYQSNVLVDTSYFRKTSSGVFYFIDTTGISQIVPDTLRSLLTVDTESRILFFPLSLNQTWPVYQIDIKIAGVPVFSPLRAYAKVIDTYKLDLVLRNSQKTFNVYKIEYNLDIQFSPESQIERQTAIAHFATGLGFIKWEGQSSVINLVRGSTLVYPSDVVIEELTTYNIP
jgi:hypothetical protein